MSGRMAARRALDAGDDVSLAVAVGPLGFERREDRAGEPLDPLGDGTFLGVTEILQLLEASNPAPTFCRRWGSGSRGWGAR